MKWNIKPAPARPTEGAVRVVRKFAFFPIEVGQYKVWLEKYNSKQVYVYTTKVQGRKMYVWQELERFL